jgi:putative spermidine/putrescine transport system permease protein
MAPQKYTTRRILSIRFWERKMLYFLCALVFAFLLFPVCIIIPMSFSAAKYVVFPPPGFSLQWYANYFNRPDWLHSTFLSLRVATAVSLIGVLLGTPAALALVRGRFKWLGHINAFILSPMIIPPIILAVSVYFLFSKWKLIGSEIGLIMAHSILAVPFVIINVTSTLKGFDVNLERAALNLGANRFQAFLYITLPIIRPGVLSGAILAFIISFDELIIAIFISGSQAVTLPRKMWEGIRIETDPTIAAVSSLLIGMSLSILLAKELLRRRSEKRIHADLSNHSLKEALYEKQG